MAANSDNDPVAQLQQFLQKHHTDSDQRRAPTGYHRFGIFVFWMRKAERDSLMEELNSIHTTALLNHYGTTDIALVPERDRMTYHRDWYGASDLYIPIHTVGWLSKTGAACMQACLEKMHERKAFIDTQNALLSDLTGVPQGAWSSIVAVDADQYCFEQTISKKTWLDKMSKGKRLNPAAAINNLLGEELFHIEHQGKDVDRLSITLEDVTRLQHLLEQPGKKEMLQQAFALPYQAARNSAVNRVALYYKDMPHR